MLSTAPSRYESAIYGTSFLRRLTSRAKTPVKRFRIPSSPTLTSTTATPHPTPVNQDVQDACKNADGQMRSLHAAASNAHVQYWEWMSPGRNFEHRRFSDGWNLGRTDARAFFRARADVIVPGGDGGGTLGCLDAWVGKKMAEAEQTKVKTAFGWEWEQGFRKGVADLYGAVSIRVLNRTDSAVYRSASLGLFIQETHGLCLSLYMTRSLVFLSGFLTISPLSPPGP